MSAPFIPPATAEKLAASHPEGTRHKAKLDIALALIGNGIPPEAVSVILRDKFPQAGEREIRGLVQWCVDRNPTPSGYGRPATAPRPLPTRPAATAKAKPTKEEAIARTESWLGAFRCDACDLWHRSPWRPLEDWRVDSLMLLAAAYGAGEFVNVVTDYTTTEKDGALKANPCGAGETKVRDDWMRAIRDHGTPQSHAGGWVRMNPVKATGSGKDGAMRDCDVTSYRFALLESDKLPHDLALSLFARLPLPILAILSSGGRGPHAWVKLDCPDAASYAADVAHIIARLLPLGIDDNNGNPSRLSRLVGAQRVIGASEGGEQQLYYLNDAPEAQPIFPKGGA